MSEHRSRHGFSELQLERVRGQVGRREGLWLRRTRSAKLCSARSSPRVLMLKTIPFADQAAFYTSSRLDAATLLRSCLALGPPAVGSTAEAVQQVSFTVYRNAEDCPATVVATSVDPEARAALKVVP